MDDMETMATERQIITMRASDGSIVKIEAYEALTSTAELARGYANDGVPDRYVVFTSRRKTGDDGEYEEGVYMSLLLRPSFFPSEAHLLGAMSATAFITALEEHTSRPLGLGWVSDIYCKGVRIGGVSIEGKLDNFAGYDYLIVTFEARLDRSDFPPLLMDMIRRVFEPDNSSIAMIIAKNILNRFFPFYVNLKTSKKFMETYTRKFILRGVRIRHIEDGKKRVRRVLGVDAKTGALILEGSRFGLKREGGSSVDTRIFITSPRSVIMPRKVMLKKEN